MGRSKAAKAQQVAEDAWDALVSGWDTTREATGDFSSATQDRVGTVTDEALRRASAAYDALAGRRPGIPWGLLIAGVAVGAVAGFVAATVVNRLPGLAALDQEEEPAAVETDIPRTY